MGAPFKKEVLKQDLLSKIQQVINEMKSIINETEEYYGIIYENLPVIEQNIELTKQETTILIDYFIDIEKAPAELKTEAEFQKQTQEKKLISQALNKIQRNFKKINRLLLNQEEIDRVLELFLNENEEQISFKALISLINETRNILEDINVISLNAIVFSSKLGEEGRAFRVVSDNIHQISAALEKEFANVKELLGTLLDWHNSLQLNIEDIVTNQEKIAQNYIVNLEETFSSVQESIQMVNGILTDLMNNVTEVVSPFQGLMTSVQSQDIIRQNLENINKSLAIIEKKYNNYLLAVEDNEDSEVVLNYSVFISKGMDLISRLTERSFEELFILLDDIVIDVKNLLTALNDTQEDAKNLTNYLYHEDLKVNEEDEAGAIDLIFEDIFSFANNFINILKNINNSIKELSNNKDLFNEKFSGLEETIEKVNNEVGGLNKIEILARIELARMKKDNSGFGQQIEEVIGSVEQKVSDNSEVFYSLKQELRGNLEEFEDIILNNQKQIDEAVLKTENSLEELGITNDIINQAVVALYKEVESLNEEVNKIYQKLQAAEDLKQTGENLLLLVEELVVEAKEIEELCLAEYGKEDWQLKNDDLKELVEQFTTYLERDTAQEFLSEESLDEVDTGSAGGDLVLF
ncbi:hypothetical protein [Fuchsiella alkaliacetigena]|uniref:hypothetical protein n=1 Tax=Fuchsiella alkaliacetigena TaxID=957042 RepID=UPI00200AAAD1|nr:hypothetical protein [Fuchsiella alkaliacetigena]MCK8823890.1 hypothetical protein [Fuchsiella alkaliacetigena]